MKKKIIFIVIAVIIVFVVVVNLDKETPGNGTSEQIDWQKYRDADVATVPSEWKTPIWLKVNTVNWEDSAYISGNGNTLYFALYPGENLHADLITGDFKDDIDVYYSEKPFTTKIKHGISEDIFSEGGVMISNSDIYYMSNRLSEEDISRAKRGEEKPNDNIYKNGIKLSFNNEVDDEGDPHFCAVKDELYFWKRVDGKEKIFVYKNNEVKELPYPINTKDINMQPFLTQDCQTMYFTSTRDGIPKIYKSYRLGENSWAKPEIFISSKYGVGEPTLTDDGKSLFFVQLFKSDDEKKVNLDIMYTERK